MANYYFLAIALPPLSLEERPEISFEQLNVLLRLNLTKSDWEKVKKIRLIYDLGNIKAFWKGEEIETHGNLDENQLEEALVSGEGLPNYIYAFMDQWRDLDDRIRNFPALLYFAYQAEISGNSGFLKKYFTFEREWRLIMAAFRAKKLGIDPVAKLQYEIPAEWEPQQPDDLVSQIVAQKDAKSFEPPEKYASLKPIFEKYYYEPLKLSRALFEWRLQEIEKMVAWDTFSTDCILAYLVKFIIIEQWLQFDKKKGGEIMGNILKEQS